MLVYSSVFLLYTFLIVSTRLEETLDQVISLVEGISIEDAQNVNPEKLKRLLNLIGMKFVQNNIYEDGLTLRSKYRDTEYLSSLNSNKFILEINQLLLSFICGAVDLDFEKQTHPSFLYAIAVTVEMVYFLRNLNLILPHCFLINLVQSFTSGSKIVTNTNGKVFPGASYTSYKTWLN